MAVLLGPYGGPGGAKVESFLPARGDMAQITVMYGDVIDSINLFSRISGEVKVAEIAGAWSGSIIKTLDLTRQHITGIRGTYGLYPDQRTVVIKQIQFTFSSGVPSDVFGLQAGDQIYQCNTPPNTLLTGFFGKVGNVIDSIGFQFS
jgi:hypothetical protein